MRNQMVTEIVKAAPLHHNMVVVSGDLGFMVFEPVIKALGDHFINAGITEPHMISMSAGLASTGHFVWVYSFASFISSRVIEQLRNDVCNHQLPVMLIGNGGGFNYGFHGESHHAIEDISLITSLPHIQAFIPSSRSDVSSIMQSLINHPRPAYLRLSKQLQTVPDYSYAPVRQFYLGNQAVCVALGDYGHRLTKLVTQMQLPISVWTITELPCNLPTKLLIEIRDTQKLMIVEEHVTHGGLGDFLARELFRRQITVKKYQHHAITNSCTQAVGDPDYFLKHNQLDDQSLMDTLTWMTI